MVLLTQRRWNRLFKKSLVVCATSLEAQTSAAVSSGPRRLPGLHGAEKARYYDSAGPSEDNQTYQIEKNNARQLSY